MYVHNFVVKKIRFSTFVLSLRRKYVGKMPAQEKTHILPNIKKTLKCSSLSTILFGLLYITSSHLYMRKW